jgi:cytochrome c oxidase subunit 2
VVLQDIESAKANTMKVRVVGEQFAWTFYYPGENGGREVASPQLYLPKDQPVEFTLQSKDVLHDFWVPAFRLKKDAVPGIDTAYRVTPNRLGDFPIVCAELCGLGHSVMRSTVHVVPRGEFQRRLGELRDSVAGNGAQTASATTVEQGASAPAAAGGRALFASAETRCGACHTLRAAGTRATIGPNLDVALRGASKAEIRAAIVDPDAQVADGYSRGIMPPNYGETLPPADLDAVAAYLAKVTR